MTIKQFKDNDIMGHVILEDVTTSKYEILSNPSSTGYLKISATLQDFTENRNGRTYDPEAIIEGLKHEYVMELIRNRSWYGESGHPLEDDIKRQSNILKPNSSHIILEYKILPDKIVGIIENSDYPLGEPFKKEILRGSTVAFSMRGIGNVKNKNGKIFVTKPLRIITYDNVLYPSHRAAYQTGVLSESGIITGLHENIHTGFKIIDITYADLKLMSEGADTIGEFIHENGFNINDIKINLAENTLDIKDFNNKSSAKLRLENCFIKKDIYKEFVKNNFKW